MKVLSSFFIVILSYVAVVAAVTNINQHEDTGKPNKSIVEILIKNVKQVSWKEDDIACYNQILATLYNARNSTLWATWVLDSIQLPNGVLYGSKYQLGNYDQCMSAPWLQSHPELRTKYCLADVQLTDDAVPSEARDFDPYEATENYINTLTKHARKLNTITWGVCVPASCAPEAVSTLVQVLFRSSALSSISLDPRVDVDECQIAGRAKEIGIGARIFLYLILSLVIIAVSSTWYFANNECGTSDSLVTRIAKLFCMNKNAYDLVKPSGEDIPSLHGMRALTAIIFVYTHQVFFVNSGAVGNGLDVDKDMDVGFFVMHTDLFTDTFLLMSGLLLVRGLAAKENLENPILLLWKRYIRLIGPMAMIVFYVAAVSTHMGDGPIWQRLAGAEQKACQRNWALSLLMLNNYVNSEDMCFITLWYVPTDYHLTILGVLLIYLCRRHRRLGVVATAAVAVLAVLLPAYATYVRRLPATIIYNVETMIDIRNNEVFNSTYIRSQYRIGSYFVGLCVGYLMTIYKPALYRNVISKKWSIIAFAAAFTIAWVPMSLGGVFYTRDYDAVEAALYAATNRVVWVLALSALVAICEYGDLRAISGLLGWRAWVPLSRLSYGLYLTHPAIIQFIVFSARAPLRQHPFTMLSDSFGPVVVGYLLSLLIWLLVQAPIINLISILHSRRKPPSEKTALEIQAKEDVRKDTNKSKML